MKPSNKRFKSLSRQFITEALISLMSEKPYEDISVTEICERAEVARRTFYLSYVSKDDVLQDYIDVLFAEFIDIHNDDQMRSPAEYARDLFDFWTQHVELITLLQQNKLFNLLLEKSPELLSDWSKYEVDKNFNITVTASEREYFTYFNTAGIYMLLDRWVKGGMRETPEQMARLYAKIMKIPFE